MIKIFFTNGNYKIMSCFLFYFDDYFLIVENSNGERFTFIKYGIKRVVLM